MILEQINVWYHHHYIYRNNGGQKAVDNIFNVLKEEKKIKGEYYIHENYLLK